MDSESVQVVIVTVLSVLVIVDIIGNALVCMVITRNQDMRYVKTKTSRPTPGRYVVWAMRLKAILVDKSKTDRKNH